MPRGAVIKVATLTLTLTLALTLTLTLALTLTLTLLKVVGTGMRGYIQSSYSMESVTGIFIGSLVGLVLCALVQLGFLHRTLANSPARARPLSPNLGHDT